MTSNHDLDQRRRSPGWVRTMSDRSLHGLAVRLRRDFWAGATTDRQEWLLDACISELEYRRRKADREGRSGCYCELCMPPFPFDQGSLAWDDDGRS